MSDGNDYDLLDDFWDPEGGPSWIASALCLVAVFIFIAAIG